MSEMSEHVAKEIHAAVSTAREWDTDAPTMKDFYRKCALAAIKAMREPTEAMIQAFRDEVYESAEAKWQVMIDAALAEPE